MRSVKTQGRWACRASKVWRSNGFLSVLSLLAWLATLLYRLAVGELGPHDTAFLIWITCNNAMLLCLGYQLRCTTIEWGERFIEKHAHRPPGERPRGFGAWLARWARRQDCDDTNPHR